MRRTRALLIILLSIGLPAVHHGEARAQDIHTQSDLRAEFGLNPFQAKIQLRNIFATEAAAQARYPFLWRHYSAIGWTGQKFLNLTAFDAAAGEVVWRGQGGYPMSGPLNTTAGWNCPEGQYYQTVTAEVGMGLYQGKGTGPVNHEWVRDVNGVLVASTMATELVIYHAQWQGDPNERHNIQSGAWGLNTNAGYLESTRILDLTLSGDQESVPAQEFRSSGLRLWKPGESSFVDRIRSNSHRDHGIEMYLPTPVYMGTITTFSNAGAGVGCLGCYGGTINIGEISGDDNWALVYSGYGNNTEGGGTWNIGIAKSEGAITGGRTWREQVFAIMEGQTAMNVGALSHVSAFERCAGLFRINPRLKDGGSQVCQVTVGALKTAGVDRVLIDEASGYSWTSPGDWQAFSFSYNSRADGGMKSSIPLTRTTGAPAVHRRIIRGPNKYPDRIYLGDEVSPPSCTGWTTGAWGPCIDGQRTRTVTATPTGCTGTPSGKPAVSEPCSSPVECVWTCSTDTLWSPWICEAGTERRTGSWTCSTGPAGCTITTPSPSTSTVQTRPCSTVPPSETLVFSTKFSSGSGSTKCFFKATKGQDMRQTQDWRCFTGVSGGRLQVRRTGLQHAYNERMDCDIQFSKMILRGYIAEGTFGVLFMGDRSGTMYQALYSSGKVYLSRMNGSGPARVDCEASWSGPDFVITVPGGINASQLLGENGVTGTLTGIDLYQ